MVYLMMTDLEMNDDSIKNVCGWVLVGLLFLALAISLQAIIIDMLKTIVRGCKKIRYKIKMRRAQKYAGEKNEMAQIFE